MNFLAQEFFCRVHPLLQKLCKASSHCWSRTTYFAGQSLLACDRFLPCLLVSCCRGIRSPHRRCELLQSPAWTRAQEDLRVLVEIRPDVWPAFVLRDQLMEFYCTVINDHYSNHVSKAIPPGPRHPRVANHHSFTLLHRQSV